MALYKQNKEGKVKGILNQSASQISVQSNYKRKANPTFISNGVFKLTSKNEIIKKNRLQQAVNIDKLRDSKNFAGSFRKKNDFLEKVISALPQRTLLIRYTSSSIFKQEDLSKLNTQRRNLSTFERTVSNESNINSKSQRIQSTYKMTYWG
jgi:hypothetical protein